MFPKSLRWRLPLSYAAIASFAALAAGVVLMTTLRSHYVQREQNYVARQAFAVSRALNYILSRGSVPLEEIQQNFPALALFTQARVQLFDAEGISHGEIKDLGPGLGIYVLAFRDPDNIQLELTAPHTPE